MKQFADFLPVLLFFIVFKMHDDMKEGVMAATGVLIAATLVQLTYSYFRYGKVEKMPMIAAILVVFFGGITLILQDEVYIKWKPTVVNWLFAFAFLGSQFIGAKNLVQRMMGGSIALPSVAWARLNYAWVVFFVLMGFVNLYVAFNFSTDIWVDFKLFGMLGLTLIFVVLQAFYISRYVEPEESATRPSED